MTAQDDGIPVVDQVALPRRVSSGEFKLAGRSKPSAPSALVVPPGCHEACCFHRLRPPQASRQPWSEDGSKRFVTPLGTNLEASGEELSEWPNALATLIVLLL